LPVSRALGVRNARQDWLRVGVCPVCRTWVLLDDEFVRSGEGTFHGECRARLDRGGTSAVSG
jgi:hypothetical protein